MLSARDVQRLLRAASWTTPQEIEAFATEAGPVAAEELAKLVNLLTDKSLAADARAHQMRCTAFARLADAAPDPDLFVPLVRALRTPDPVLRAALTPVVLKVNNVSKHAELCQLLGAPEAELRKVAAQILRQIGGPSAFQILRDLVREKGFAGRAETMFAIVPKALHHSVPLLQGVLQAGDPNERIMALRYLGDARVMGKDVPAAIGAIKLAFEDPEPRVLTEAIGALASVAAEEDFYKTLEPYIEDGNVTRAKAIVAAAARYGSDRAIDFLTKRFRAGPNVVRLHVLDAVAGLNTDRTVPLLVEALGHRRIDVRTKGAETLVTLSGKGALDPARVIIWLLRSRDVNMRRMAVEVARKVGDASGEVAPKLLRFLRDEDWWVRERVMDALVEMSGAALTKHLVDYLNDGSDVVRRFAIGGLQRLKDPRSIGALVRAAMGDTDWWVRETAVQVIASLGDARAVPYLLQFLDTHASERVVCIEALTQLDAKAAAPKVLEFIGDADPDVRVAAIRALTTLGDASMAPAVQPRAKDEVFRVRAAALDALARWNLSAEQARGADSSLGMLDRLLVAVSRAGADDLLIAAGRPSYVKKLGKIEVLSPTVLNEEQVRLLLFPHLSAAQQADAEAARDIDFSYEVKTHGLRFRAHIFHQMTGLAAVFRIVKNEVVSLDRLGLPAIVGTFADFKNGLVLVGGPTGSGKSTTLAALIHHINESRGMHVVTIEDPIEVVHSSIKSLINQREVGSHTASFQQALRSTLREDPDVLLVGEMRDLETISFAVTAAETGHLVFGTVHTVSADTSIDRLVNAFPAGSQPQVRAMLSESLRAVVCQHLLRRVDGPGRACAVEVMINNDAIANMIRKGKTFQISQVIATSRDLGMQSMDSELVRLAKAGVISRDDAYMKAIDKKMVEAALAAPKAAPAAEPRPAQTAAPPAPHGTHGSVATRIPTARREA